MNKSSTYYNRCGKLVLFLCPLVFSGLQSPCLPDQPNQASNKQIQAIASARTLTKFSAHPTDEEFFSNFIFQEPMLPMGCTTTDSENRELANAILKFQDRTREDDFSAIADFLASHPHSPWRVALLTNLGLLYRQCGYFTRALDAWEEAWRLGQPETERTRKALVDRALGELADLHARLGRQDRLREIFSQIECRTIVGPATEAVMGAREGSWGMKHMSGESFLCGPLALANLYRSVKGVEKVDSVISSARSSTNGTSLAQVSELAHRAGLDYQIARRQPGASLLAPSVIHWKAGHFAALIREEMGRYLVKDPTFGQDFWVSKEAVDDQASGFFLVQSGKLPEGWQSVLVEEARLVWGKGNAKKGDPRCTRCYDEKVGGDCPGCSKAAAMPGYSIHTMLVSLNIVDTPVFFSPPRGPSLDFTVTYNQRDAGQDANLNYPNLGSKWSCSWVCFVREIIGNNTAVQLVTPGGGYEDYQNLNPTTGLYALQLKTRAQLKKTGASGYELTFPDGSKQIFGRPTGGTPNEWFITQAIDPLGNTLEFSYSLVPPLRLLTVSTKSGGTTIATANLSYSDYKITQVTIQMTANSTATRTANLFYGADGELAAIRDAVGLTSSFSYDPDSDFVNSLKTPYGTTTFSQAPPPSDSEANDRWMTITDPLGHQEKFAYVIENTDMPKTESVSPDGMPVPIFSDDDGQHLQYRNTFYWDKNATALTADPQNPDWQKAHIFHWLHRGNSDGATEIQAAGILESEKLPLENRVWYQYPNQSSSDSMTIPNANDSASRGDPMAIARVLDDGSTQITKLEYNDLGALTSSTDPLQRKTDYIYDPNNIDLLEIRQKTAGINELLASFTYGSHPHLPDTAKDASGQTTTLTYSSHHQLRFVENAKHEITEFVYDDNTGFLQKVIAPNLTGLTADQRTTTFAPDSFYRVGSITDGEGYQITFKYDDLDRITEIGYPDSTTNKIVYNKLDPVLFKDRMNRWSASEYDALRHLVATRDPAGKITQFYYCICGALSSIVDPLGQTTTWLRDLQGRPTDKFYPDGTKVTFAYETTTSRLRSVTDAKGQQAIFSYYPDNNLWLQFYQNAQIPTPSISFTYDLLYNRVSTIQDGTGTTAYTYNPITTTPALGAGRLATVDGPWVDDTIAYTYDELGRTKTRTIGGSSTATTYTYDPLGRIGGIANPLGSFTYDYVNATPRVYQISSPTGPTTTFSYFPKTDLQNRERLQQIQNKYGTSTILSQFDYDYDAEGEIKTWTRTFGTDPSTFYSFGYDAAYQLLRASLTNGTPASPSTLVKEHFYSYDAAGNRTSEAFATTATTPGLTNTARYNNVNQLVKIAGGERLTFQGTISEKGIVKVQRVPANTSLTAFKSDVTVSVDSPLVTITATTTNYGATKTNIYELIATAAAPNSFVPESFTYDLNGNLLAMVQDTKTNTYLWDAADRLVAIEKNVAGSIVSRTEFTYDGLGRRVQILETDGSGTKGLKRFVWCGSELCQERDAQNAVVKEFYPQGMINSGVSYFYTRDHLGSVREMVDSSGVLHARYDYDPYGRRGANQVTGANAVEADFGFTGHYFHSPSGLHLATYRPYDSETGRWFSRDPIKETGGLNLYDYVSDNPANLADPHGLFVPTPVVVVATGPVAVLTTIVLIEALSAPPSPTLYPNFDSGNPIPSSVTMTLPKAPTPKPLVLRPPGRPPRTPRCRPTSGFPGEDPHNHHRLPRQFKPFFESKGLNIEDYKTPVPMQWHIGEEIGIHPQGYNDYWADWIDANPDATAQQVLDFMEYLEGYMGFGHY